MMGYHSLCLLVSVYKFLRVARNCWGLEIKMLLELHFSDMQFVLCICWYLRKAKIDDYINME